jgi:hypothetical protein
MTPIRLMVWGERSLVLDVEWETMMGIYLVERDKSLGWVPIYNNEGTKGESSLARILQWFD